jgi:hypothetical protein
MALIVGMNPEDLLKHTEIAMSSARKALLDKGKVLPTLVMVPGNNQPFIFAPVPDMKIIPHILRREKPEAFTWVYEVLIRIPQSDQSREAIEAIGRSGITIVSIRQEYHRQDGKIVFDKALTSSDTALAASIFERGMRDGLFGEIMGLWEVAPPGGRVVQALMYGLNIWVPEGWKMAKENDSKDGKPKPTFYRDRNPHGALRISTMWRKADMTVDVLKEADENAEKGRTTPGVDGVEIERRPASVVVTWRKVMNMPGADPMWAYVWWIHDAAGLILLSFTYVTSFSPTDVAEEMASVREIVNRISRV